MKTNLERDVTKMIADKVVTIPETIVPYIFKFITYVLKGVFHLNREACPSTVLQNIGVNTASLKRRAIVIRLSEGDGGDRKRRIYLLDQQLCILKAQAVVTSPTHRSVALERNLSPDALGYLVNHFDFTEDDLITLNTAKNVLSN